jgi:hypothetical protein
MEGWSTHLISKIWNLLDEEHRWELIPCYPLRSVPRPHKFLHDERGQNDTKQG